MTSTALPLFYVQPRPLQPTLHGRLSLADEARYGFAAQTNAVPLVASEMAIACRHFPIVFTDGDQAAPAAVLGLRSQENLFVDEQGHWHDGGYVPAYIRRYPFIFMESADGSEFTLCIDEQAAAVTSDTGTGADTDANEGVDAKAIASKALFDETGSPTAFTQSALDFCRDYQNQHALTMEFMRALQEADLLVENRADISVADGQKLSLSGFRVIDEAKFNRLPVDELLRWRANGWLPLVYSHLISNGTWAALVHRLPAA